MAKALCGFYCGGEGEYARVLRLERDAKIAPLRAELNSSRDENRRTELKGLIKTVKQEFTQDMRDMGYSLF